MVMRKDDSGWRVVNRKIDVAGMTDLEATRSVAEFWKDYESDFEVVTRSSPNSDERDGDVIDTTRRVKLK